jgi:acetyl-CoA carboxylase / biotin carboxylase 1
MFNSLTSQLSQAILPYTKSRIAGVPGSERALQSFLSMLRKWISVERSFCDGKSFADAVDNLRKANKDDAPAVLAICRAHEQVLATSEIIIRIISIIGDGARVDFHGSTPSAIGKRVSIVAGAESLPLALPVVAEIGSMGSSDLYSEVALRARKLLMQESMPSLEQRKQKVLNAASILSKSDSKKLPREADVLLADNIPMSDVLFPLLQLVRASSEEVGLLELYLRNLYRPYTVKEFTRDVSRRLVRFTFLNKPSESAINVSTCTSVHSMTDLSRIVSTGSLTLMSEASDLSNEGKMSDVQRISPSTLRVGACAVVEHLDELSASKKFESVLEAFPHFVGETQPGDGAPANVLYFVVLDALVDADEASNDAYVARCEAILERYKPSLMKACVRRVSFVFSQAQQDEFHDFAPALFTFLNPDFREDALYRRIDPSLSMHLHLNRVASNFKVRSLGSRHTSTCHVHLYEGIPKSSALAKDRKANAQPRVFARALSLMLEFSSSGFERILVDALNAMDLCPLKSKSDNHLFLNLVSDFERSVIDPVVVEQVVVEILKTHSERVSGLHIVEVETRIVCCLSPDTPPIALRLFASNPTGYVHVMNTYIEATSEAGGERVFKLISGTKASLASSGDSSWDGLQVDTPYPLTRPFDAQRKAALLSSDTIYCYDLPALFEAAVEKQWVESTNKGSIEGGFPAGRPLMIMYTTELVVKRKAASIAEKWTMKDYLNGDLELVSESRRAGLNDVGMVAWVVTLKTVEYPNVRVDKFNWRILSSATLTVSHLPVNSGSPSRSHCERYHSQGW